MPSLVSRSQNKILLDDLRVASGFWDRLKGLLGTTSLGATQGLWIHSCNSIHTYFMKYTIDCVFLDSRLKVHSIVSNVRPGRVVWPQWGAVSVIEMKDGQANVLGIKIGDELDVGG